MIVRNFWNGKKWKKEIYVLLPHCFVNEKRVGGQICIGYKYCSVIIVLKVLSFFAFSSKIIQVSYSVNRKICFPPNNASDLCLENIDVIYWLSPLRNNENAHDIMETLKKTTRLGFEIKIWKENDFLQFLEHYSIVVVGRAENGVREKSCTLNNNNYRYFIRRRIIQRSCERAIRYSAFSSTRNLPRSHWPVAGVSLCTKLKWLKTSGYLNVTLYFGKQKTEKKTKNCARVIMSKVFIGTWNFNRRFIKRISARFDVCDNYTNGKVVDIDGYGGKGDTCPRRLSRGKYTANTEQYTFIAVKTSCGRGLR